MKPILFICLIALSGCAYGYADQEGKPYKSQTYTTPKRTEVVRMEKKEAQPGAEQAEGSPAKPACGVDTFEIHFYSPTSRITKTVDCAERKIVQIQRNPMGDGSLQQAREAGLPEETWYVLVDPDGLRANYLSNAEFIEIAGEYDLDFLGKYQKEDLLIYEYRGPTE